GRAKKEQVMEMTKRLLNLPKMPKLDDTADALAIAICHTQSNATPLKNLLKNGKA
ncbi:MAG: crossover junction endodeoxyribonuclease RuvC, partial [Clostridia bacterium]|nr:crossover junction endodeoxyribonuclease RuvC [Clostridia bacterium]